METKSPVTAKKKIEGVDFNMGKILLILLSLIAAAASMYMTISGVEEKESREGKKITEKLKEIKGGDFRLGILPDAGGRIVFLVGENGENIFKSDPGVWDLNYTKSVYNMLDNRLIPFNGHIVWLGPQSMWWQQQNESTFLKAQKAQWPPDPFQIYGAFKVLEHTKSFIVLRGPDSPYTGIRLTKIYSIDENGRVFIRAEGKNIRKSEVSWDIWFNTRFDGWTKVYVPVLSEKDVRVDSMVSKSSETLDYIIRDGYFSFIPSLPSINKRAKQSKAFLNPSNNKMFAFSSQYMFVINFNLYQKDDIHPEQAIVEVYNRIEVDGEGLVELEHHTPFRTLKPGEEMEGREIWDIVPYGGRNRRAEHIDSIERYLKGEINGQRKGTVLG